MRFLFVVLAFSLFQLSHAQEKNVLGKPLTVEGPLIHDYGKTFMIKEADLDIKTRTDLVFKPVFDIAKAPEDPAEVNVYFNTVARFLNMHAIHRVPLKNLQPAMVVHGSAAFGLLTNEAYKEKFGVDNPNLPLLDKLHSSGVLIIMCSQTAGAREIYKEMRWEHTKMALSAMTALIQLQEGGYKLISF